MKRRICLEQERLLEEIEKRIYSTKEELAHAMDVSVEDVAIALNNLKESFDVSFTKQGKVALASTMGYFKGKLEKKQRGYAFLRTAQEYDDIFVGDREQNGAMSGEEVVVRLKSKQTGGRHLEGKVIKILSELPVTIVGTAQVQKHVVFVIDEAMQIEDVFIPKSGAKGVKNGQKVVAEITKRAQNRRSAEGRITEVLGNPNDVGVDILCKARNFGLLPNFPIEVEKEAKDLVLCEQTINDRVDLRAEKIITIDGEHAKDLDDAVSLKLNENGNFVLGVHIADVSHFVRENSELNKEALKRGTSVYLIDRVIPMLPKELSNGLCSLHPNEDKLTLSCIMEISPTGELVSHEICNTVIRSSHKMTYDEVNSIFDGDTKKAEQYEDVLEMLNSMNELAKILRKRRFDKGCIDFDLPEADITLNKKGRPVKIEVCERGDSQKLIEEFMLMCNTTVAEQFYFMEMPFLYRVHEQPDGDRMKELAVFLQNFGIKLKGFSDVHPRAVQEVLKSVEGTKDSSIVNSVTLRSLKKAKYDVMPSAHFGLAADRYCHFTSPIRRYPDLMIHRISKLLLSGELNEKNVAKLEKILPDIARQSSERERNAIEAERAVNDMKMAEFMQQHLGEDFEGVVSGVAQFGVFVELQNTIEGMVPLACLQDDYYVYHEKMYCVIGERTKKKITLGDKVNIRVMYSDISTGKIEFMLI